MPGGYHLHPFRVETGSHYVDQDIDQLQVPFARLQSAEIVYHHTQPTPPL